MKFILFLFIFFLFQGTLYSQNVLSVYDLSCDYRKNPINLDEPHPQLGWKNRSQLRNHIQTAFEIMVASDSQKLMQGLGDIWRSGKIYSNQNLSVPYQGIPLKSNQTYWWKVRIWGNHADSSDWSSPNYWRTGLLQEKDWRGFWIGSDLELNDLQKQLKSLPDFNMETEDSNWAFVDKLRKMPKEEELAPAVYLRKEFTSTNKIRDAFVTISGLGFYELYINGSRISDEYLNPTIADYQKRVYYNVYDVTTIIQPGENAVGVILGNGWYNLIIPHVLRYQTADYIEPPTLKMELRITYADGKTESIVSDKSWKFTTNGPIRFNCILGGETYDNTKRIDGWDQAGFSDFHWKNALIKQPPPGRLDAQEVYPVRKTGFHPAKSIRIKQDTVIVDFGMELTGWAQVRIKGRKGQMIQVAYPGAPSHTLGRYQLCRYILNGDSAEMFESRFSYNGFNKLEITGLDYQPELTDFTAVSVNSDLPVAGSFECSNDTINRLQAIIKQTIQNYIVHLPNDPTREKAGWSQDIQNAFDVTAYNFDAYSLYRKWQLDFLDIQHNNGYVPPVVPGRFDGPTINCPWWGGMIVYQPWKLYEYYADKRMLEASYPAMKKYLDFLLSISNNYTISWGLGDWLEPGSVRPIHTPVALTSTLGFYYYATIAEQTAAILNLNEDRERYQQLAEQIKRAYNHTFYDQETGKYATGSQACQLMSLFLGVVPAENEAMVKSALIRQIEADQMHLSTGFVSTPYLLNGLNNLGYSGIAYTIGTQNSYPSWFDMVFNHGHNVLNEHWDGGAVQMPALGGGIGSWFYASLAGLKADLNAPGFKEMFIEPAYGTPLTYVRSTYQTLFGEVKIAWTKGEDHIRLELDIPENTKAKVALPSNDITHVLDHGRPVTGFIEIGYFRTDKGKPYLIIGSGKYDFSIPFSK